MVAFQRPLPGLRHKTIPCRACPIIWSSFALPQRGRLWTKTLETLISNNHLVKDSSNPGNHDDNSTLSLLGSLDVQRFDVLAYASPTDFQNLVHEVPNDDLDWNSTVFCTIADPQVTQKLQQRFGRRPLHADPVIRNACEKARQLPPQQHWAPAHLLDFTKNECEFKNEHADGSFFDHLDFCAECGTQCFPGSSPNVLLLHSICGVSTNLFPLDWSKMPQLEELMMPHDALHVQAFQPCCAFCFVSSWMISLTNNKLVNQNTIGRGLLLRHFMAKR